MHTVEFKKQTFTFNRFAPVEVTEVTLRAEEDVTARLMDDIDARIAFSIGCLPPPYHLTRTFATRMRHARTDLERSELATLKMLLETFLP